MNDPGEDLIAGDAARLTTLLPDARFVFDWNGTLINDAERTLTALNATLRDLAIDPLDDDAFRQHFRLPMESFLELIGVPRSEITPALIAWQTGIEEQQAPLAPGVAETLRALHKRGRPAGVISAGFTAGVMHDAIRLGIRDWLAFLHGSVASKSDELRKLVVPGQTLIYIGDTEYDMREAVAAGAAPVGYGRGYRPASALLDVGAIAVINDFRVLLGQTEA